MSKRRANRLKHGAYSEQTLLRGETQKELDQLRDDLYAEWQPAGPTEAHLVEELLNLIWRARRYRRHTQIDEKKKLKAIRRSNEASHYIDALRAFVPAFEKAKTKEEVEVVFATLTEADAAVIRRRWPLNEGEDSNKLGEKIAKGLAGWNVTRYDDLEEFLEVGDPADFALSLKLIEPLDAKTKQTINRLTRLKAEKQALRTLELKPVRTILAKEQAAIAPPIARNTG